jgi:hypothetical protein
MKSIFFVALLLTGTLVNAQTLREALYGGKLKNDTGSTVRKTDDIKSKIDSNRKAPEPAVEKPVITRTDSLKAAIANETAVTQSKEIAKDNNTIWKEFIEKISTDIRTEVIPSKKMKSGTFSVLLEYEIGTDGQIAVLNVSSDPGNSFLEDQIKERITLGAPQLTPSLGVNGKPRKVNKKQLLSFSK